MSIYEIEYGTTKIAFSVERKKVKNVNVNIRSNGEVVVSAGEEVPTDYILAFVKRKADWISKQIVYFKEHYVPESGPKELVSGESFKYLGRQYRLKVVEGEEEYVRYYRGYIYLYVKDKNKYSRKEKLLNQWFDSKCKDVFAEVYKTVYHVLKKYDVPEVSINIRKMKSRWGSCLREKKEIILNRELIKAPRYCIQYVMLHELVHMIYKDHSKDFYDFLYTLMPDWKERKRILDEEVIMNL